MSKGNFFTGQPIFNQILSHISRGRVKALGRSCNADRYCKSFGTYEHLVTMLYAILNRCDSLREVTTGLLAWEQRICHLGLKAHPRRSTLSDANKRRSEKVFEKIYFDLLARYERILPDSRQQNKQGNLYIFDSTSIALFQEILKASGLSCKDGRRKGGIKVHTLLHSERDTPVMIRYSPAAQSDVTFLKEVQLAKGSVIVFDKGYCDYRTYNRFIGDEVTFVTRLYSRSVYQVLEQRLVSVDQQQLGVQDDHLIMLGYTYLKKAVQVPARLITYIDPGTQKQYQFLTNNTELDPLTIANYYRQRWQIETFFKRIKQNYPLQYFLGDNANAIKIQIWCVLIADLLLKVIRQGCRSAMSFSNMVALVRINLMTYMDLKSFLRSPEKSLLRRLKHLSIENKGPCCLTHRGPANTKTFIFAL
ncbi:IS4 family transposase [Paraflavitalea soli]|uniref:IS4 family transposase n=1 Tax=Paraflavitalea soli TaxID=2315862 RepID=A0A3B7MQF6_9BACT|nr:IS4 family transposase [Paraflavitalea soli]AXY73825.1 IS4 family transposase [Paraflavitalea soli]